MFVVENWGWPQWVFVAFVLLGIGVSAACSGKKKEHGSFGSILVGKIVQTVILICGGFYQTISWPQIVWVVLLVIELGLGYRLSGQTVKESLLATLLGSALTMFLLIMGGFFA